MWALRFLKKHRRLCLFAALLVGAALLYRYSGLSAALEVGHLGLLRDQALSWGWPGAALLVSVYVLFVTLGLPNLPFQLAAGAIYGTWPAFALMYFGVNLGALCAFAFARFLGRKSIEEFGGQKLGALNKTIETGGFRYVLVLRLIPLMPFNAINYASGLSRLRVRQYLKANVLGMIPLTYVHVAVGKVLGKTDFSDTASILKSLKDPNLAVPLGISLSLFLAALAFGRRAHAQTKRAKARAGLR